MKVVFVLIGVQFLIVTALGVGVWLWLRPKPGPTNVANTTTQPLRSKPASHARPAARNSPPHPTDQKIQPNSEPTDPIQPDKIQVSPMPPRPDDPAVPGLVAKLKSAAPEARLAIIEDLSDRGNSARKAVPALVDLLKQHAGPVQVAVGADPTAAAQERTTLVTAILKAIQQIGVEPALVGPLLVDLRGKDENVATASAYVLALAGEPALDKLLPLLRDKDPVLRYRALRALFYCPSLPDRALQPVIDRLSDDSEAVRQAAPGVLIHLGPRAAPAVPALIKGLEARRVLAAMALGAIGPAAREAVPALRQALKNKDAVTDLITYTDPVLIRLGLTKPSLAGAAAAALVQIGPAAEPAIPDLVATLQHKQADARLQAVRALGRLGSDSPAAPPALARLMKDNREMALLRAEAVEALGQLGKPAIPSLMEGLKLRPAELRADAVRGLGRNAPLPPAAITALAQALSDSEPAVRVAAARVLGQAGEQGLKAVADLGRALTAAGQDTEVIGAVAQALANLGDPGTAVLLKGLDAQAPAVRRGCAQALGMCAAPPAGAARALAKTLGDREESVRAAAAEALGRLGPEAKSALPALKELAAKDSSAAVRQAAADAVSRVGEP